MLETDQAWSVYGFTYPNYLAELGANAVIGARYDATEIMQGVTEVLCYGTAVVVKPTR